MLNKKRHLAERLGQLIAGRPFFKNRIKKIDQESFGPPSHAAKFNRTVTILIVGACLASVLWFLGIRIGSYFESKSELYTNPNIFNLTMEKIQWDTYYGSSKLCGDLDCHLQQDFPSSEFSKKVVLPVQEFPLKDFQKGDFVFVRTTIIVPENLIALHEPIAFHSLYIWAKKYWFYVNGRLLEEGSTELLNITIPGDLIPPDRKLYIAIKMDPADLANQGIAHRGELLLGPKALLKQTAYAAEEQKTTYFLWFLLPRLAFFIMFAFLFVAVSQNREIFSFLIYSFLGAAQLFLASDYGETMIHGSFHRPLLGTVLQNLSLIAFIHFVYSFYRRKDKATERIIFGLTAIVVISSAYVVSALPVSDSFFWIRITGAILKPAGIVYGIYQSLLACGYLAQSGRSQGRVKISAFLIGFFLISLIPVGLYSLRVIGDLFGIELVGRAAGSMFAWTFDLMFFIALSAVTAIEYGALISAKFQIEGRLNVIEERLELARTVQTMLLPNKMSGSDFGFDYRCFYDPSDKVSGDWLFIDDAVEGSKTLYFGDVVGKGPSAAIGVASVISLLNESRELIHSPEESISMVNRGLFQLFGGSITTTLSAITFTASGRVSLYAHGTVGWFRVGKGWSKYVPVRGGLLGTSLTVEIHEQSLMLENGEQVLSFTDGYGEGSVLIKKIAEGLSIRSEDGESRIREYLNGLDKDRLDDKTLVLVRRRAEYSNSA